MLYPLLHTYIYIYNLNVGRHLMRKYNYFPTEKNIRRSKNPIRIHLYIIKRQVEEKILSNGFFVTSIFFSMSNFQS